MEAPVKRKWLALSLMAVVLPVGLLLGFKLTGVLPDPPKPETITLEAVKWELERPAQHIKIRERVESVYDEDLSIVQSVLIGHFIKKAGEYGGADYVALTINVTATTQDGHIANVHLIFREDCESAIIDFFEFHEHARCTNLSIVDYEDWGKEIFVDLAGLHQPSNVGFSTPVWWILRCKNNETHQMEIVSEVTYFNGTIYRKVVQPFHLKIGPDDNNSFETADQISEGTHSRLHLGGYDAEDYYKIQVGGGYLIQVYAESTSYPGLTEPDFYIAIYSPEREWKNGSSGHGYSHLVSFFADSTGYWFIRTSIFGNYGFYMLDVTIHSADEGV